MKMQAKKAAAQVLLAFLCCTQVRAGLERPAAARPPPATAVSPDGDAAVSVASLSGKLAAGGYWTREKATRNLIAIGRKDIDHRNLVRSAMNRQRRNCDPEASQRALRVLKALAPPPVVPRSVDAVTKAS